ncbi:hypothetical protein [Pseudopedobacter beijingensis]|uniref:Uncharacterized protein n=1 Tax=Pseudopedobacter beijingensis TaxID=1207056 RepID=A0ABW4I9G8_9SPHI
MEKDTGDIKKSIHEIYAKCEAEKYLEVKSYSLEITENGFLRYKRVWKNNKSEFFSVKLEKLDDMSYYGTDKQGTFYFKCSPETVIYQTRRDPRGDIDSMANEISFPVVNMDEEQLNFFVNNINSLKGLFVKK